MAKLVDELSALSVVSAFSIVLFTCCELGTLEGSAVSQPQKIRHRASANNIKIGFMSNKNRLFVSDKIDLNL